MYAAIAAEADHEISDEEVNMRGYSIIEVELKGYYDGAYNYVEYTEEEAQARKAIAENIKKELATSDLETLAEKYDLEISTKAYAKNDESLDENILAALDKLAVGDTPAAVETEDAVYFVRIDTDCDKEATEENRLIIITERESVHFQEVLLGWQENDDWTVNEKVVAKIDFRNILTTKDGTEDSTQTEASESTETTESE